MILTVALYSVVLGLTEERNLFGPFSIVQNFQIFSSFSCVYIVFCSSLEQRLQDKSV